MTALVIWIIGYRALWYWEDYVESTHAHRSYGIVYTPSKATAWSRLVTWIVVAMYLILVNYGVL